MSFQFSDSTMVILDFLKWSGWVTLPVKDIPNGTKTLPPKDLYASGKIKIFDTDKLKVFRNFRTAADRVLESFGIQPEGFTGWLVDTKNLDEVERNLGAIRTEWEQALQDFLSSYPDAADAWAASQGKWESLIRSKQPDAMELVNRFRCNWFTINVDPLFSQTHGNSTSDLVSTIPDYALQALITDLTNLYNDSFNKQNDPSSKAYGALKRIADRAVNLSFANPVASQLSNVLTTLVNQKNHTLSRLVLSQMGDAQGVYDILQLDSTQGIASVITTQSIQDAYEAYKARTIPLATYNEAVDKLPLEEQIFWRLPEGNELIGLAIPTMHNALVRGGIDRDDYNAWLTRCLECGHLDSDKFEQWYRPVSLIPQVEEPVKAVEEPVKAVEEPLNSMDVLDSLGLF